MRKRFQFVDVDSFDIMWSTALDKAINDLEFINNQKKKLSS